MKGIGEQKSIYKKYLGDLIERGIFPHFQLIY